MKINLCKLCGNEYEASRGAKELCHKHIMAFYRREKRRKTALKALNEITELEQVVFGKKNISLDTSATSYVIPKEVVDTVRN